MNNDILLSRKILSWGWYKDANTFRVFIHLLLSANWKDGEYMGKKILRGQCVFGRKQLSKDLSLSEREIRTAINHLKLTNEIAIESTNKFSIATIVKYNRYQLSADFIDQQATIENCKQNMSDNKNHKNLTNNLTGKATNSQHLENVGNMQDYRLSSYLNVQQIDQQKGQQMTSNRPSNDQQSTTSNLGNSNKSLNKENIYISSDNPKKPEKESYGEFQNVKLTVEEYVKLSERLGNQTQAYIDRLDGYIASKGVRYKNHYATILNWYRKDEESSNKPEKKQSTGNPFLDMLEDENGQN